MGTVTDQIRLDNVTKGLLPSYQKRLSSLSPFHISVISSYISAIETEIKLSDTYKQFILNTLITLSRYFPNKTFRNFSRADIIKYLDHFKKEDSQDPSHKWIGTYNAHLINIIKFFKWLYSPNLEPKKRPKPKVVQNLSKFRRREISNYKPSDMWGPEDNLIFLKYCPNSRDKCYHSMETDIGARPHELLKLRIKDIEFKEEGGIRYAEIVVNGKTGQRVMPLIDSIPYVISWISLHPQGSNKEAFLLPSQNTGKMMKVNAMTKAYDKYKKYFKTLLSSNVSEEDKKKITNLLKKPWNLYVHRHSSLTEKSGLLSSDAKLRQFAGWASRSQMHHKYVHFSGGESMKDLLKAKGIIKEDKQSVNILQPKICPSCRESNRPDAPFCYKCNFVLSFDVYQKGVDEREKKDQEVKELNKRMAQMEGQAQSNMDDMKKMERLILMLKNEFDLYREHKGSLTISENEREKHFKEYLERVKKTKSYNG